MQSGRIAELLERAAFDERSADILLAHNGPETTIGFLCQQAVEKLLKGVLLSKGIHVGKTHDIVFLKQELEHAGEELPMEFARLDLLQPYAVDERYGDTGATGIIAMQDARDLVTKVRMWARAQLGG